MVRVKIQLGLADNADKFVWRHPEESKYSHLIDFITDTFDGISESDFQIQYKDDEGDLITCSSESDINDALHFAEEEGLKSLKLFVITDVEMDAEEEEEEEQSEHDDVQVIEMDDIDDEDDRGMLDQREQIPVANNAEEEDEEDDEEEEDHIIEDESPLVHSEDREEEEDEEELETFAPNDEEEAVLEVSQQTEQIEHETVIAPIEREEDPVPTIKDILQSIHREICQNKAIANDLVITISTNWPLNAAYPIHLGAMLQHMIEDESKKNFYGFIVEHEQYPVLQSALKQYSGAELQGHIKQMANLCRTVGAEKFSSLSVNVLDAFKTVLEGGAFELDFGPLLMATTPKQKRKASPSPTTPMELKQSGKGDEV